MPRWRVAASTLGQALNFDQVRDGFPDKPFSPGGGLFCSGYSAKTARLTNNFSRISID
jgi:hypothetical protein